MKMTFRWFGENDPVPLEFIKQIPNMSGVVTAVYDTPVGDVWPLKKLENIKLMCQQHGLEMKVIESIPVHEDIKLGLPSRDKYIENYIQNIKNVAKVGVECVCYNFMPVFDWVRTNVNYVNDDGSTCLSYSDDDIKKIDPKHLHLPGWDESYKENELQKAIEAYKNVDREKLFDNLIYFLKAIMPTCDETSINMAIHPADPPWTIFNLPRIICSEADYDKLFKAVPNKHNGLTLCTGSLGAGRDNDLPKIAAKYTNRIFFTHIRQLKFNGAVDFMEAGHLTKNGDLDIYAIVKALVKNGFKGFVRPDHGRNIWGEKRKPGYGLYDRALGATYLNGLFEAIEKDNL